jgi:predicted nucleic acid-binding protein
VVESIFGAAAIGNGEGVILRNESGRYILTELTTANYVVDETVTLLRVRHSHEAAVDFLETVEQSSSLALEWMDTDRFQSASAFFRGHRDREWSFTDCVSFCLMRELRIRDAFTTDHHFKQAGFVPLLKK